MSAVVPNTALTHGTIECADGRRSGEFYTKILGLGSVRPLPEAQYLWSGGDWSLVCVAVGGPPKRQPPENRFALRVATAAEVDDAHAQISAVAADYGLREIGAVTEDALGVRRFLFGDMDGNWWEIYSRPDDLLDAIFARNG
jgi:catechol 2,3-dioxygenase-like lactoylglutathione lyase family enzyme